MTLRELRHSRGMTQAQLAELIGWSPSQIGHCELTGRLADRSFIGPLARALSVTPDEMADALSVSTKARPARTRVDLPSNGRCGDCGRRVYALMGAHPLPSLVDCCRWCGRARETAVAE